MYCLQFAGSESFAFAFKVHDLPGYEVPAASGPGQLAYVIRSGIPAGRGHAADTLKRHCLQCIPR